MRLTIRQKLIGNLLILLMLMGTVGIISMSQFNAVDHEARMLYEDEVQALSTLAKLQFNLALVMTSAALSTTLADAQEIRKTVDSGHQTEQEALEGMAAFLKLSGGPEERASAQELEAAVKSYLDAKEITYQLALKGEQESARANMQTNAKSKFASLVGKLNRSFETTNSHAEERHHAVERTVEQGRALNLGILLLAIIAGMTGGLLLARSIGRNLQAVAQAVDCVAKGDLSQELEIRSNDEFGDMARSVQHMIGNLRTIVSQVNQAANSVAAGTEQISASTEQISLTAQSQAAATDETSSSIAEIASSITMVATNVTCAKDVAIQAFDSAQMGRKTVSQTIDGMAKLSETIGEVTATIERLGRSSAQIGAIVELIDDIAKQTNLLALNATIEAARAGENGRGFAVVADEVRQLAKRSTEATGNISELIRGIQGEMARAVESTRQGEEALQGGTQLAHEAGQSLEAIVESVEQVRTWMEQIHRATQEQGMASDQIVHASEHLSTSTRESTQAITQIADSATSLQGLGRELVGAIAFFGMDSAAEAKRGSSRDMPRSM